jgi:hypothetical protein
MELSMQIKKTSLNTFLFILFFFLISRGGIYITTYFGYNLFSHYDTPPQFFSEHGGSKMVLPIFIKDSYKPVLNDYIKFDSPFYLRIAERGYDQYRMDEEHPPADWPFFPLYPLLMRGIHTVFNLNLPLIGFLLSNIFFFSALYVIFLITEEVTGEKKIAEKTIMYLLLFPTSIYFSLVYTESLFLFLSSLVFLFLFRKKYHWSFLCAALCAITRVPGIVLIGIVFFVLLKESNFRPIKISFRYWASAFFSLLPFLSFLFFMYRLTGDFLAPFHENALNWQRTLSYPWQAYLNFFKTQHFIALGGWDLTPVSFFFANFFLFMVVHCFFSLKKRPELILYGILLTLISLCSMNTNFTSFLRYQSVVFPLFLGMGNLGTKYSWVDYLIILFFSIFQVIYSIGFINNYFFVV